MSYVAEVHMMAEKEECGVKYLACIASIMHTAVICLELVEQGLRYRGNRKRTGVVATTGFRTLADHRRCFATGQCVVSLWLSALIWMLLPGCCSFVFSAAVGTTRLKSRRQHKIWHPSTNTTTGRGDEQV